MYTAVMFAMQPLNVPMTQIGVARNTCYDQRSIASNKNDSQSVKLCMECPSAWLCCLLN